MPVLDVVSISFVGVLVGNELAVSLFVNPAIWRLEEKPRAQALSMLARALGAVMPIWYFLCLVLLIAETCIRWHEPHTHLLHAALCIWAVTIVYTVTLLVPINNRIARLDVNALPEHWLKSHVTWDKLHRGRIFMLFVAMICLTWNIIISK